MKDVVLGQYKGIEFPAQLKGREKEDYLMKILVESSKAKVSESSVNERAKMMTEEYALRLTQQGLSIEQYYEASKTDEKALVKKMQGIAKSQLKGKMILEAIAEKENITVTQQDVDTEIKKLTMRYPLDEKKIREIMKGAEERRLKKDILTRKAMDFVSEHAVEAATV